MVGFLLKVLCSVIEKNLELSTPKTLEDGTVTYKQILMMLLFGFFIFGCQQVSPEAEQSNVSSQQEPPRLIDQIVVELTSEESSEETFAQYVVEKGLDNDVFEYYTFVDSLKKLDGLAELHHLFFEISFQERAHDSVLQGDRMNYSEDEILEILRAAVEVIQYHNARLSALLHGGDPDGLKRERFMSSASTDLIESPERKYNTLFMFDMEVSQNAIRFYTESVRDLARDSLKEGLQSL